jgi:hypothetical protein
MLFVTWANYSALCEDVKLPNYLCRARDSDSLALSQFSAGILRQPVRVFSCANASVTQPAWRTASVCTQCAALAASMARPVHRKSPPPAAWGLSLPRSLPARPGGRTFAGILARFSRAGSMNQTLPPATPRPTGGVCLPRLVHAGAGELDRGRRIVPRRQLLPLPGALQLLDLVAQADVELAGPVLAVDLALPLDPIIAVPHLQLGPVGPGAIV